MPFHEIIRQLNDEERGRGIEEHKLTYYDPDQNE